MSEIEWELLVRAQSECPLINSGAKSVDDYHVVRAVLGSDGTYHPVGVEGLICGTPDESGTVHHWRSYNTMRRDGVYKARPHITTVSGPMGWESVRREYEWKFTLTTEYRDPASVHTRQRCDAGRWPGFRNPVSGVGKIRVALADRLGNECHCCYQCPNQYVDHDHLTGTVRGLLCGDCNGQVDQCTHVSGCIYADYLNAPPAAPFGLQYPKYRKTASDLRREAMLGVPMTATPPVSQWRWSPTFGVRFYPASYGIEHWLTLVRNAAKSAVRCDCRSNRADCSEIYAGVATVTRHDQCGGVVDITYRCSHGCRHLRGKQKATKAQAFECATCRMPLCGGCTRVPSRVDRVQRYCDECAPAHHKALRHSRLVTLRA
jgi:hypothetical protein